MGWVWCREVHVGVWEHCRASYRLLRRSSPLLSLGVPARWPVAETTPLAQVCTGSTIFSPERGIQIQEIAVSLTSVGSEALA